jgi:hypothetical protein
MHLPDSQHTAAGTQSKVCLVIATRETREGFFANTATGRSLTLRETPAVNLYLQTENREGLPMVYNRAIEASRHDPAVLIFLHDDIHLCDFYWADQARDSLAHFQIAGLAGSKLRIPKQPSWAFVDEKLTWATRENLSGIVGHGKGYPPAQLAVFGPPRQEVKLLDGLMLIAHSETLIAHDLRFDERFDFNFYDLDFCRQAELKKLKMGTWPISVVHESTGDYLSESWRNGYRKYIEKWGD